MFALGEQIAQLRPSASASTIFSATLRTEITRVRIVNTTATEEWFRIFHDDDGTTFDESTAIQWDTSVAARGFVDIEINSNGSGFFIGRSGNLGFTASTDRAFTVTVYGVTENIASDVVHNY